MIEGHPKFNGLAVGEFTCNLLGTTVAMKAKAAFVDKRTGNTHGWTEFSNWAPSTIQKMRELVEAMEADLARWHFESVTSSSETVTDPTTKPGLSSGLGEHVAGEGEQI